jgi:dihydrofolate reductase
MDVNKWHSTAVHHTSISLGQKTYFSFYGYLILQLEVQFNYISHHTSEISRHTGWETLFHDSIF